MPYTDTLLGGSTWHMRALRGALSSFISGRSIIVWITFGSRFPAGK